LQGAEGKVICSAGSSRGSRSLSSERQSTDAIYEKPGALKIELRKFSWGGGIDSKRNKKEGEPKQGVQREKERMGALLSFSHMRTNREWCSGSRRERNVAINV